MYNFITKLNKTLNAQLENIDLEEQSLLNKARKSISCIKNALKQLKAFVLEYTFKSDDEEIEFFKKIKPEIFSKLIYFTKIYNIESRRPYGTHEIQIEFLGEELEIINSFFKSHLQFYQYYRMNSTFLDDKCFLRDKEDLHLFQDSLFHIIDPEFSTTHDYMVAEIMANDMLIVFLNTELAKLSLKNANPNWDQLGGFETDLQWTDSKSSIVELIYALCEAGVINKGRCEIRHLSACFEQVFNINLTDIYRTFVEVKLRSNPTKFIDSLKVALLRKIEEEAQNGCKMLLILGVLLSNDCFI